MSIRKSVELAFTAGVGSPVLRRTGRISDEISLGGPSLGTYYCARVVSVMIAQRWEIRVQRGTQPVRLKTGCTNFRLEIEPSSCAFLTIIPPRNRQRFNPPPANYHLQTTTCKLPPANYHLCGLSWEGSSSTANHQGRFQIQARSLIMAREASRWLLAFRLWGLWDSGSPLLALFCSLATITTTSAPTLIQSNSIAIKCDVPGRPRALTRSIELLTDQAPVVPAGPH